MLAHVTSKEVTEIRPALPGCWIYANPLDLLIRGTQLNIHLGDKPAQTAFFYHPQNLLSEAGCILWMLSGWGSSLCCSFPRAFPAGCPTLRPQPREKQQSSGFQEPQRHFPTPKGFLKRSRFPSERQTSCKHASFLCAAVSSRLNIQSRSRRQPSSAPKALLPPPRILKPPQRFV